MSEKKKYIVEAGDDIQLVTLTGVKDGSAITITGVIDTLETAEKLEEEAYERGHDRGYKECLSEHDFDKACSFCDDYERGLNDAWETARKIILSETDGGWPVLLKLRAFETWNRYSIVKDWSAQEAVEKMKAYETVKDEIRVGDEVKQVNDSGKPTGVDCIVTHISGDAMHGIQRNGRVVSCGSQVNRWWKKTGRHFDIESILKEMQE